MCALNYFEDLLLEVGGEVRAFVHSNKAFLYFSVLLYTYVRSYTYALCPKPNDMIADDEWCDFPMIVDSSCFLLCQFHHQTAQFPTTTKYARTTYAARS